MTTSYTPHDEEIVDQLLLEADMQGSAELKAVLLELRSFAGGPPVLPSAELVALMETGPVSLDARRRLKRRAGIVALVVVASMGMGTTAVAAADPGFREKAQETITTVIDTVTRGLSGLPAPARTPGSPEPPGRSKDHPTPDHPTPAGDTPGKVGQETRPSSAPGQANSGLENQPSPKPGTPSSAGGQGNVPAAPDRQNAGSRTSSAPPTGAHD
jgi:hypothetical protein